MSVEMFYTTLPHDIERERPPGNLVFKPKLSTSHFISFVYKHNEVKTIQKNLRLCWTCSPIALSSLLPKQEHMTANYMPFTR